MLLYLLSVAAFYSAGIVKVIVILSLTYAGGFFLITALNIKCNTHHSTITTTATRTTGIQLSGNNDTTSEGDYADPASHLARNRQNVGNLPPTLRIRTHQCDNSLSTHFIEKFDDASHGINSTNSSTVTNSNYKNVSAQTPELLDTLSEENKSPAISDFGNNKISGVENENEGDNDTTGGALLLTSISAKNANLPLRSSPISPIPTPSLSSSSSMDTSRAFSLGSQTNTIPLSTCSDVLARIPPLDLSPSVSTSTTISHQCLTPTPSCSTTSTSSLRQHRRNSRVGQLVQQFEIGRLEKSISTPILKLDKVYPYSTYPKVTDTIATLHKCKNGTSKIPQRIHTNTTAMTPTSTSIYSPTLCHSPKNLMPSTSTRTIDQRSIGFQTAFATWKNKVSEAKRSVTPSPSMSTPVLSSSSITRN